MLHFPFAIISFLSAANAPAIVVVPPARGLPDVAPAVLAARAVDAATPHMRGSVVVAALPAGTCELRCRLDAARASGAPVAVLVDVGVLGGAAQIGIALVEPDAGRTLAQHAESVAPASIDDAIARGVRDVLGRAAPGDRAAALAQAASGARRAAPSGPPSAETMGSSSTTPRERAPRIVIAPPKLSSILGLDAASASALSARAASIARREEQFVVVTTDEVAAVLKNDRDRADLGAGNRDVFARAAAELDAQLLLLLDVGAFGDAALVSARAVDAHLQGTESARAEIVVDDPAQIPAAVDAVVMRLFGHNAPVPPPRAPPSRFESAIKKVARALTPAFLDVTGKKVAVQPLVERGDVAVAMKIGASTQTLLWRTLAEGLPGPSWQPLSSSPPPGDLAVVVRGTVSDVGTDLLIDAEAIDVVDGSVRAHGTALFPRGDQATLIPLERLVQKTRGEAMFRALVPGGGQFFNGPAHAWKGIVVASGAGLATVSAAGFAALAWRDGAEKANYQPPVNDPGPNFYTSNERCITSPQDSPCAQKVAELDASSRQWATASLASLAVGGVFYAAGFVDAALFAE